MHDALQAGQQLLKYRSKPTSTVRCIVIGKVITEKLQKTTNSHTLTQLLINTKPTFSIHTALGVRGLAIFY